MLRIKNKHVLGSYLLLKGLSLPFKESRIRVKFCNLLAGHNDLVYIPAKQELINHFSYINEDGKTVVANENIQSFNNEIRILDNEEFELECNELNKSMLLTINEILHNEEIFNSLNGDDAELHDLLCDIFEEIEREYNN